MRAYSAHQSFPVHRLLVLALCLGVSACDLGGDPNYPVARLRHQSAPHYKQSASILGDGGVARDVLATGNGAIGVDNRLWRAALETVSFMPLVSADATGGVIITDWYAAPDAPDQRQKLNVYILGRELRPDSLRVSVFRQQRGSDGSWVDVPPASNTVTDFENAILTRARQVSTLEPRTLRAPATGPMAGASC